MEEDKQEEQNSISRRQSITDTGLPDLSLVLDDNPKFELEDEDWFPESGLGQFVRKHRILRHLNNHKPPDGASRLTKLRYRIGETLESTKAQYFLIGLIFFDILILVVELVVEKNHYEYLGESAAHTAHIVLFVATVIVLCLFELEILLLLFAFGWRFFTHPLYVLDLVVITGAIIVEIIFINTIGGILILLRLWRLLRITHAVILEVEEVQKKHMKKLKEAKKMNNILQDEINQLNQENELLKNQLLRMRSQLSILRSSMHLQPSLNGTRSSYSINKSRDTSSSHLLASVDRGSNHNKDNSDSTID